MKIGNAILFSCLVVCIRGLESQSHLKISNNGYQLLVVAVHDSVPDDPALLQKLKVRDRSIDRSLID